MTDNTVRLHITPLTPDLLPVFLGQGIVKQASAISYHSLQTFPESNYGYINLPYAEAEKVKRKLNGSIMKGKKVKIEEARPMKRKRIDRVTEQEPEQHHGPVSKKTRKAEKNKNVVEGHELSPGRQVKRGWTKVKSEKARNEKAKSKSDQRSQAPSKYTGKEELLFRTKIPDNKMSAGERTSTERKKKLGGNTNVVHEFKKSTTIPSFLRTEVLARGDGAAEYRDEEGWVNQAGDVVEPERRRVSQRRKAAKEGLEAAIQTMPVRKPQKKVAKDGATRSLSEDDSGDDRENDAERAHTSKIKTEAEGESTSSSGTSESDFSSSNGSDSGSDSDSDSDSDSADVSTDNEQQQLEPIDTIPVDTAIHPLEALFKKPLKPASTKGRGVFEDVAKPSLEVQTAFSFFDQQDTADDLPPMPMTPFSSQDLRTREIRSAAPTPDTAHPSRMSSVFNEQESEDDDLSEMEDDAGEETTAQQTQQSEGKNAANRHTDFEKWFWENRGRLNRAWKARRRAALKEKRQRENRSRRPRNW